MAKIIEDFDVPDYITEELSDYIDMTEKGYCKAMKWENIKSLLNLATINNRITKEQAEFLEKKYCREN